MKWSRFENTVMKLSSIPLTRTYLYANSYSGKGYHVEDLGGAMRDVYRSQDGVAHKSNGIQIISPGADGKYGIGGLFDPEHANAVLASERIVERDNLTNLMPGTLGEQPHPQTIFLITLGIINLVVFLVIAVTCKLRWGALLLLIVLVIVNSPLVVPAIFGISSVSQQPPMRRIQSNVNSWR